MNEQIYILLNEIDNQPDSYEIPQVSDLEMKKWKKQFSICYATSVFFPPCFPPQP